MARRGHLVPSSVPTSSSDPAPALTLRKEDKLAGHNGRVFDLQASVKDLSSSQPLRIAAVGEKGGSVWTFDGGARRHVRLPGTELMRVCWHPDGEHVLTGSAEGAICVRDASSGQTSATLQAAREDEVYGLEVLSEEGLLAAGAGETVQLWDLNRATRTSLAAFTATESGVHFGARTLPRHVPTRPCCEARRFPRVRQPSLRTSPAGQAACATRTERRLSFRSLRAAASSPPLCRTALCGCLTPRRCRSSPRSACRTRRPPSPPPPSGHLGPSWVLSGTLGYSRVLWGTLGSSRVLSAHLGYPQLISGSSLMALRRPPSPPPSRRPPRCSPAPTGRGACCCGI